MKTKQYTNRKEKIIGIIYVFLLFGVFIFVGGYLLFMHNRNNSIFAKKGNAIQKMSKLKEFRDVQLIQLEIVDSLYYRIDRFRPDIAASYEDNEINILLRELNTIYENNSFDRRYKAFMHISKFYQMWLSDKKELWCKNQNIAKFSRNLEDCEIGLQKRTDELNGKQNK